MVEYLSPLEITRPEKFAGADHPMRKVTQETAFDPGSWTPERRQRVADLFDGLAEQWQSRHAEPRILPLRDALNRGRCQPGLCLEPGCGTGPATAMLATHFQRVIAMDLSWEMLRRVTVPGVPRILTDASQTPLSDHSVDTIVLMNMLLFPTEVERLLKPAGSVIWINSRGDQTPIHLSPEQLLEALPGSWEARSAKAGAGLWAVARRRSD